jgi:hypothetical protein
LCRLTSECIDRTEQTYSETYAILFFPWQNCSSLEYTWRKITTRRRGNRQQEKGMRNPSSTIIA